MGQTRNPDGGAPNFGASRAIDYELEMAFYVGPGNDLGRPIPLAGAADHVFGLSLLNDWSARDLHAWEAQPLGPFLGNVMFDVTPETPYWVTGGIMVAAFLAAMMLRRAPVPSDP